MVTSLYVVRPQIQTFLLPQLQHLSLRLCQGTRWMLEPQISCSYFTLPPEGQAERNSQLSQFHISRISDPPQIILCIVLWLHLTHNLQFESISKDLAFTLRDHIKLLGRLENAVVYFRWQHAQLKIRVQLLRRKREIDTGKCSQQALLQISCF